MNIRHLYFLKHLLLFAVVAIITTESNSQTLSLTVKAPLPGILTESSGVAALNRNSIWSHNDNSGNAELYNFDSTGTLLRTLKILNATNVDWEDLAKDTAGNFYIGDIGNNANTRQDLRVYKIPNPSTISGDSVAPQIINYSYPDQFAFPPPDSIKNFDSEAMIVYNDSLYIFSKDWSDPFTGYTKLYRLPAVPGTYIAELVDSFYTGPGPYIIYSTTGAAISADQSRLILIGYKKCWLFTGYTGADFFSGNCQVFDFSGLTQKEAVCFISANEVYITDENSSGSGQKLYYLNLQPYLPTTGITETNDTEILIFPNPFVANVSIKGTFREPGSYELIITNETGQKSFSKVFYSESTFSDICIEHTAFNKPGVYVVQIIQNDKPVFIKKVIKAL